MKNSLQLPLYKIILYMLPSLVKEMMGKKTVLPQKIKDYTLVRPFTKVHTYNSAYSIGIYALHGKEYFIKYWQFPLKDLNYFYLKNEYYMTNYIYTKIHNHTSVNYIPHMIELIEDRYLAIVSEYIDGASLATESQKTRITTCLEALAYVTGLSSVITEKDQAYITTRTLNHYLLSLPFLIIFLCITHPKHIQQIMKAYTICLSKTKNIPTNHYVLAHRDLDASNILYTSSGMYITDWETCALTLPYYDLVRMSILEKDIVFNEKQNQYLKSDTGIFLKNYILLHLAASSFKSKKLVDTYLEEVTR